jgi:hypothetical protein
MMGGNLTLCDEWTTALLTNDEVLAVDQHSTGNHAIVSTEKAALWVARSESGDGHYVAIFNLDNVSLTLKYSWKEAGLPEGKYHVRDLWDHKKLATMEGLTVTLRPHASVLYKVTNP